MRISFPRTRINRLHRTGKLLLAMALAAGCSLPAPRPSQPLEWVQVAPDGLGFVLVPSGRSFSPWGFNYDHDERERLLEDYWEAEWVKVEEDFGEMKALGANVVRVHLQFGKFLPEPNASGEPAGERSLAMLSRLLALAERVGLYLDITGLGCYRKEDTPPWYDALSEDERWNAQARFWEAVALRCASSPAVFCYDLMNEPVSPAGRRQPGDWLGPPFEGKFCFVQMIALDQAGRERPAIARDWIHRLTAAIRKHDPRHLITVGLVDWSLDRPGLTSGFVPARIAAELDFVSVHVYPQVGKMQDVLDTLRGFAAGKPVVVEETFPLQCSADELWSLIEASRGVVSGWIGFYWGKTPAECRASGQIADAIVLAWLELFQVLARKRN